MALFDYVVVLGHFEPFLIADEPVLHYALEVGSRVIVVLGAAGRARTIRHPWTADERRAMVIAAAGERADRICIRAVREYLYDSERWAWAVQEAVQDALSTAGSPPASTPSIGLMAPAHDAAADRLPMFPQWTPLQPALPGNGSREPGTVQARNRWLDRDDALADSVPATVLTQLRALQAGDAFARLVREREILRAGQARFAMLEYPPVFVTVDAVVVHSGHVLLIERDGDPGRGLWALPGGFLDQRERLLDACLRELREETNIALTETALRGAIRDAAVFDHPERSLRGRTITHAWYFCFGSGPLPAIRPGDDARKARWIPLAEAFRMEPQFFDDHFDILLRFVG